MKILYVLDSIHGETLAICSSKRELKKAVDHWMEVKPLTTTLVWEWTPNSYEADSGDWAYIAPIAKGLEGLCYGGWDPPKDLWGLNLIEINTTPFWEAWDARQ